MAVSSSFKGPHKARRLPLLVAATRHGYRLFDYRLAQLFDSADVISEGASKNSEATAAEEHAYFGTTNIVLTPYAAGSPTPTVPPELLVRIFSWDPHVRTRALRIACREARVRANGLIDRVRTEIVVSHNAAEIRIHVDVEARVLSSFPRSLDASLRKASAVGSRSKAARRAR